MLAGKQWFSTLDLASGYWQVSLSQEARVKTAFATHAGLFQFRGMPFGLCNAPATFEQLMDRVLQGPRWSRCLVYLDDIISFGSTFDRGLECDPAKIEDVKSWPVPDCAEIATPLVTLTGKDVPFVWDAGCSTAFQGGGDLGNYGWRGRVCVNKGEVTKCRVGGWVPPIPLDTQLPPPPRGLQAV